jgi:hypothetical protein
VSDVKSTEELSSRAIALEIGLEQGGASHDCRIEIKNGDWGGLQAVISLSPLSAIHIARQLIQLASKDFGGAHFHVDKASIAPTSHDQIVFSLTVDEE